MKHLVFSCIAALSLLTSSPADAEIFEAPLAHPKTLTAFTFGERYVEILAVTRKARADTALRFRHLEEAREMSKVLPGYPQPPLISFDLRISF